MMYELVETQHFTKWRAKIKDSKAATAVSVRLIRATNGHFGDSEPVGEGVSEMRIFTGKGYRIYYIIQNKRLILLLNGGIKSSKKQQQDDIKKAKAILKSWEY